VGTPKGPAEYRPSGGNALNLKVAKLVQVLSQCFKARRNCGGPYALSGGDGQLLFTRVIFRPANRLAYFIDLYGFNEPLR